LLSIASTPRLVVQAEQSQLMIDAIRDVVDPMGVR
jgi:hypothetical protein